MKLRQSKSPILFVGVLAALPVLGWLVAGSASAAHRPKVAAVARPKVLEVWPGQRVVLLMPLKLGEGFNVDPSFGNAILPDAQQALMDTLTASGKFSVIKAYRFNPILQRAVQERRITKDMLTALVDTPTLENARAVMSKLDPSFDQAPLIGDFSIEELRLSGTDKDTRVQAQVSGRLYEVDNAVAWKSAVVTSAVIGGGTGVASRTVYAASDAFSTLVAEFVQPIDEPTITIPTAAPPLVPAAPPVAEIPQPAVPEPTAPAVAGPPIIIPPAGTDNESLTGSSARSIAPVPRLPAPTPPLGLNAPDAPSVGH